MSKIWNNTCVVICNTGNVVLSNPLVKGHNAAISDCANQIGLDIPTEQPMPAMLEVLTFDNHTVLLNCGRVLDNEGLEKRTGYLALPTTFTFEQIKQVENLKLLLEEYQSLTVWKLENGKLKTKSMGNSMQAISIVQEMIEETLNKNISNIQK